MLQAGSDCTTLRERAFAPCFDFAERKALTEFGFHFESTEGSEAAELKGRCSITTIPPKHGEEFTVLIILPDKTLMECRIQRRQIVWEHAR